MNLSKLRGCGIRKVQLIMINNIRCQPPSALNGVVRFVEEINAGAAFKNNKRSFYKGPLTTVKPMIYKPEIPNDMRKMEEVILEKYKDVLQKSSENGIKRKIAS